MMIKRRITFLLSLLVLATAMAQAQTVYVSKAGKSYHTSKECQYIRRSTTVTAMPLADAQKRGLNPCKACVKRDQKKS